MPPQPPIPPPSIINRTLPLLSLTIPVAIWFRDTFYSTYTIRGDSMSPTLEDGDVVIVRKSDVTLFDLFRNNEDSYPSNSWLSFGSYGSVGGEGGGCHDDDDVMTRGMIRRMDDLSGRQPVWFYSRPVAPLPGDVVLFQSPTAFPNEICVKRVVAVGGQRIRPAERRRVVETVPMYGLWMEGDNRERCEDSGVYGAVSKKLLIGTVERVVWPPWRWGAVRREKPMVGRAWWP